MAIGASCPKTRFTFFNKTDGDLARLTKALGVDSEVDVVRSPVCYVRDEQKGRGRLVVENNRDKINKKLIPT